jgi:hypothetical protein
MISTRIELAGEAEISSQLSNFPLQMNGTRRRAMAINK